MKLVIFSICKDEESTIGDVLDRIPPSFPGISEIAKVVISDGSQDKTALVAKRHGAKVYEEPTQKRLAYRFQQAVEIALKLKADIMVNIDGDLQFDPADIPKLIKPVLKEGYDFTAADRFTDVKTGKLVKPDNMSLAKYLANRIGAKIVGNLSGHQFRDVTCGFRAYSRRALLALNINSKYTYTQESFQVLAMKRLEIKTVPIKVKYYPGRKSRVVTSFVGFLLGSALNIMRAYRDFAPLRFFGWIGTTFFTIGFMLLIFMGQHWLRTGSFTPYKFIGFAGIYFVTLALLIWVIALMADMLNRILNNQEKIIEHLKQQRFVDKK